MGEPDRVRFRVWSEVTKKAAVVGSKGFIGTRLVTALRGSGYEVVELDLPEIDISVSMFDDPLMVESLSGVDVLFHLAVMNLEHCKSDHRGCILNNVLGTANVMELARRTGIRRVIYSSASSVYGDPVKLPVSESDPAMPLTLYGATKLASEKIIHAYSNNFGLTYGIFRLTNVYGPGQVNGLIPSVIRNLLSGTEISITGNGEQTRDFVYVDDVVNILIESIDHPKYSFISNLGSGRHSSVNKAVEMCGDLMGVNPRVKHTLMQKDRNEFRADLTMFKYRFHCYEFVPFSEGLYSTIQWWKNHEPQA